MSGIVLRLPGYLWALPVTLVGLLFVPVACLTGGRFRIVAGVIEVQGGLVATFLRGSFLGFRGGAAMTLGHVILGRNVQCLETSRAHERVHVRQFERWGPLLLPLYFLAGRRARWRGLDPHLDNLFEIEAYERGRHGE